MKLLLISTLFLVLVALGVSAQTATLDSTPLKIGDKNQDRVTVASSFTVTNTGNASCTADVNTIAVSNSATSQSASSYVKYAVAGGSFQSGLPGITLQPGSNTVNIQVAIPDDFDGVDSSLRPISFKVSDIQVSGCGATVTRALEVQAVNQLEIKDADFCYTNPTEGAQEDCSSIDDGDDVKNILPGAKARLTVNAENKFSDNDDSGEKIKDIQINDVQLEINVDDQDFDVDEDENLDDIDANDEQEETVTFDVDEDVKDGTYDLVIRVFGTDENGAFHGEEFKVDLEVERRTHDLIIRSGSFQPNKVACAPRTATARYGFRNTGTRDEDDVVFEVSNSQLGILQTKDHGDVDEDDSESGSMTITVPESTTPGTYTFFFRSYYDTDSLSSEKSVDLVVEACGTGSEEEEEEVVPPVVQPPVVITPPTPVVQPRAAPTVRTAATTESTGFGSWYVIAMIIAIVVVLVIIIALIMAMVRRNSAEE